MITEFDKSAMADILADKCGSKYNWYTCYLLRLIAKASKMNRETLRIVYPEEVAAYEEWYKGEGE